MDKYEKLVEEIGKQVESENLYDGSAQNKCSASVDATKQLIKHWEDFLKHLDENKFFINKEHEFLNVYIKRVPICKVKEGEVFYRARENKNQEEFGRQGLMAPNPEICNAGRLNPKGVAYMYMGDSPITAISEIRCWIGAKVQVAKCTPKRDLILKDFTYNNQEKDPMILKYNKLLSEMFSKPVSVHDKDKEYNITQCVAEYIKSFKEIQDGQQGYDGIRYTSSAHSKGFNVVIFNPQNINIVEVSQRMEIKDIKIECPEVEKFIRA